MECNTVSVMYACIYIDLINPATVPTSSCSHSRDVFLYRVLNFGFILSEPQNETYVLIEHRDFATNVSSRTDDRYR